MGIADGVAIRDAGASSDGDDVEKVDGIAGEVAIRVEVVSSSLLLLSF